MKLIKSFFWTVGAGALFVISIFMVMMGLLVIDPRIHARVTDWVSAVDPAITTGTGLVLGIVSLVLLSLAGKDPETAGAFTFEGNKGPVDISLKALEDYIASHFAKKPVAHSVRARVGTTRDKKKIRVRASISVWSEQSLKSAGEDVQREIEKCLSEGLGLDNVDNVHVSVDKIIASKSSRPSPRAVLEKVLSRETDKEKTGADETGEDDGSQQE